MARIVDRAQVIQEIVSVLTREVTDREKPYLAALEGDDSESIRVFEDDLLRVMSLRELYLRELDRQEYTP